MVRRSYTKEVGVAEYGFYHHAIAALVERRKELGFSQDRVAHLIGFSEGMVAKWEALDRLPTAFSLMCWCNALGVTLEIVEKK